MTTIMPHKSVMDINKMISEMSLEEKASLCSGKDFWHTEAVGRLGLESVQVSDGPHGLRKQGQKAGDNLGIGESIKAVCFPTAVGLAASFNRDMLKKLGETLGDECQAENISVILGPAVNIKRSPLCGRNFEYFSEDPYLSGEMAASYINGVQSKGVGTSIKHFAANSQEKRRLSISSVIDERTFREIYLYSFEKAIKVSSPWTVMCSYNKINGEYSSENKKLLTDILRNEWGFKGLVVSDWGAVNDRVKGVEAGLDLEMPSSGGLNDKKIVEAVINGTLDKKFLDESARRVIDIVEKYNKNKVNNTFFDRALHHKRAEKFAEESMVLLKNDGILPLKKKTKIAFIGEFADKPRYQGSGSSRINSFRITGAVEASRYIGNITYSKGFRTDKDVVNRKLADEAINAAKEAETAVIFAGLPDSFESEGYDRKSLSLPSNQNKLIDEICAVQKNVIVVLHNGSPVTMPWLSKVRAVLESYLAGEGVGTAQVKILFGDVNPSGKLAETFPLSLKDIPSSSNFPGNEKTVEYREGLYVGYRYFDTAEKKVLFPFGYGLSYTKFEYKDLVLNCNKKIMGEKIEAEFTLRNCGRYSGSEIVQIYVSHKNPKVYKAKKELKGFEKVFLKRGEETKISVTLDDRAFSYYDVDEKEWKVESGEYEIIVAASSVDIRLKETIEVLGDKTDTISETPQCYYDADVLNVTDESFEKLLGHPIPNPHYDTDAEITSSSTLFDAKHTKWGKKIVNAIFKLTLSDKKADGGIATGLCDTPINRFATLTDGKITEEMVEKLVDLLNGKDAAKNAGFILKKVPSTLIKFVKPKNK